MSNQLTPAQQNYVSVVKDLTQEIASTMNKEEQFRFITIAKDRFRVQPELAECTPISVLNAFRELAISKVEPRQEHAILNVRFNKDKNVKECHLQWTSEGKKRTINVATNGEMYVIADIICRKDKYKTGGFPRRLITHDYEFGDRGDVIGAYAVLMRASDDSQVQMIEMTTEEIQHIRDTYSDSYKAGTSEWKNGKRTVDRNDKSGTTWDKEFSEMCIKTAVGRLHKRIKANINSYVQHKNELRLDRSESHSEVDPFELADAVANPNVVNNPDQPEEIDVNEEATIDIDTQSDGALMADSKPETKI